MTMWRLSLLRALRFFLISAVVTAGCSPKSTNQVDSRGGSTVSQSANALSAEERAAGWRLLFDGNSTAGWRGYKRSDAPAGWTASDGALTRVGSGGDIISVDQFGSFELALQWKVAPGGNSGVMFHVVEGPDETYKSGPEMQVLDDAAHPDGKSRLTAAGAAYGLYPAPAGVVRAAGEWNDARLVVNGGHVEQFLNGTRMAAYDLGSPDWEQRVKASKFVEWPTYGRASSGHIALQDHGDWVAYRNIKIRVLP